jgi:hypothetical protein
MRKNEEIEKLEARVEYLERSFDNLTDTLIRIPIIKRGFPSAYQRFFHIDNSIARLKSIPKKIDLFRI